MSKPRKKSTGYQMLTDAAFEAECDVALTADFLQYLATVIPIACDKLQSVGYSFVENDVLSTVRELLIQKLEAELATAPDDLGVRQSYAAEIKKLRAAKIEGQDLDQFRRAERGD